MKKIRKNILKLFLFICLGLTLTSLVFASARTIGYVPSAPGRPVIMSIQIGGCHFRFEPPIFTGGSPVLNYVIEHRYKNSSKWEISGISYTNSFLAYNMRTGDSAEFRVSAVNKFGRSQPSSASEMVKFE